MMLQIYKRCSRCGKRILSGTNCSCYTDRHKQYKKERTDIKEQKLYNSSEWKKIRNVWDESKN